VYTLRNPSYSGPSEHKEKTSYSRPFECKYIYSNNIVYIVLHKYMAVHVAYSCSYIDPLNGYQ